MKERLSYISFLQVVGPILVILGHSSNGMPTSDWYYIFSKEWIYIFHMPLFFFISGYLFTHNSGIKNNNYKLFISNKFKRLIIPYIFWNLLFLVPKFIFQDFIVDNVEMNVEYFIRLLIVPRANILGHTWFLAALFIVYAFAPIYEKVILSKVKSKYFAWAVISIALIGLYLYPIPTGVFSLRDLSHNLLFFWAGLILGTFNFSEVKKIVSDKRYFWSLLVGTIGITIYTLININLKWATMLTCMLTLLSLFSLSVYFNINYEGLEKLAKKSFAIYIMHWPFMLVTRVALYQVLGLNSSVVIGLMSIIGFFAPNIVIILMNRMVLNKLKKRAGILLGI